MSTTIKQKIINSAATSNSIYSTIIDSVNAAKASAAAAEKSFSDSPTSNSAKNAKNKSVTAANNAEKILNKTGTYLKLLNDDAKPLINSLNDKMIIILRYSSYWTNSTLYTINKYITNLRNYKTSVETSATEASTQASLADTASDSSIASNELYNSIVDSAKDALNSSVAASGSASLAAEKALTHKVVANKSEVNNTATEANIASNAAKKASDDAKKASDDAKKIVNAYNASNTQIINDSETNKLTLLKTKVDIAKTEAAKQALIASEASQKIQMFTSIVCDDNCKQDIDSYYTQYNNYFQNNEHLDITLKTVINETEQEMNREYMLLFVWFIITIIIVVITIIGVLSNEMNNYILFISLGFLIFIVFFIFKNIYKYFNV